MTGFAPGKQTTEYGQLDTLLTDGQTPAAVRMICSST